MALFLSRGEQRQPLTRSRRAESPRLCTRMGAPSLAHVGDRTSSRVFHPDPNGPSQHARCRIPPNVRHSDHAASASSRVHAASPRSPERGGQRTEPCLVSGSMTNTCPSSWSSASRVLSRSTGYHCECHQVSIGPRARSQHVYSHDMSIGQQPQQPHLRNTAERQRISTTSSQPLHRHAIMDVPRRD